MVKNLEQSFRQLEQIFEAVEAEIDEIFGQVDHFEGQLVLLFVAKRGCLLHHIVQIGSNKVDSGLKLGIFGDLSQLVKQGAGRWGGERWLWGVGRAGHRWRVSNGISSSDALDLGRIRRARVVGRVEEQILRIIRSVVARMSEKRTISPNDAWAIPEVAKSLEAIHPSKNDNEKDKTIVPQSFPESVKMQWIFCERGSGSEKDNVQLWCWGWREQAQMRG